MTEDKNIFIHIPKTGGVTINTAMHNVPTQTKMDFNYRHLDLRTLSSNCSDIFEPSNLDRYREYNIITMVREPTDRLISQFVDYKDRAILNKVLRARSINFKEYVSNPRTANYMVGFLMGKPLYSKDKITTSDLDKVVKAIEELPIHVGVFEHYNESMGYFQDVTGISWHKKLAVKRMAFTRPAVSDLSEEDISLFRKKNEIDLEFYNYCLERFEPQRKKYEGFRLNFVYNKYDQVIPFATKICFFEICLQNKNYIRQNFDFFKDLNFYLLEDRNIKDGKQFCELWNQSFLNAVKSKFNGSDFHQVLAEAMSKDEDPLQTTINIGEAMDAFFRKEGKKADKYFKPLQFNAEQVKAVKSSSSGFFGRLFGK